MLREFADLPLDELCDEVLKRLFLPDAQDDVAMLAIRLHPQDAAPGEAGLRCAGGIEPARRAPEAGTDAELRLRRRPEPVAGAGAAGRRRPAPPSRATPTAPAAPATSTMTRPRPAAGPAPAGPASTVSAAAPMSAATAL